MTRRQPASRHTGAPLNSRQRREALHATALALLERLTTTETTNEESRHARQQ